MNNIINFIKKKKILVFTLFSLSALIFIVVKINTQKKVLKPAIKTNSEIASFGEIKPGASFDEEKINELLGFPVSATSSGDIKINNYRSSNQYRDNQIEITNNKIYFVREVINPGDSRNSTSITNVYGGAEKVLYEKASDISFNLYVYLKNGIAYLGHEDGTVLEIWYFEPTDIETFIKNWAPNYQETPFESQSTH